MKYDGESLHRWVLAHAEPSYQAFSASLLPNVPDLLGVRLPVLRRLARVLAKEDAAHYVSEISNASFEERMLRGMVIGYANAEEETRWRWVDVYLSAIDNWSICDSFCATLAGRMGEEEARRAWPRVKAYSASEQPFTARFGVVMMIDMYMRPESIDDVLCALPGVRCEAYYARMAVAWALATAWGYFPAKTRLCMQEAAFDPWVIEKAAQKMIESRRITASDKEEIRKTYRRRNRS